MLGAVRERKQEAPLRFRRLARVCVIDKLRLSEGAHVGAKVGVGVG